MIKVETIYAATNGGLDIILRYLPEVRDCVGTKKKFRLRPEERTPSASLMAPDTKYPYYRIYDFGEGGHAISPMDLFMREEGFTNSRFNEAVLRLAAEFNVKDELNRAVNKPRFDSRPAKENEPEGFVTYKLMKKIPEEHLKIFGPNVTHEHTDFLHWHEAEFVGQVKDGVLRLKYSTETYPIFMRECITKEGEKFYKKYEPLNPEKGFRFSFIPKGGKEKNYINGLRELDNQIELLNALREPDDPEIEKLDEIFICSGERDAICCLSMGFHPIWFNSETYDLSQSEYELLASKAKTIYNIPDLDATGRKRGAALAMQYLDIKTVWLPDWLMEYKDNRGKPRKDLRDWMEIRSMKKDFKGIKETALQAKFWDAYPNSKTGKIEYSISAVRLYHFLQLNGFYMMHDEDSDNPRYIRVVGNVVQNIRARDVRKFVREWAVERCLPEGVRNLIANSMKFSEASLENLKEVTLDFTSFTPHSQLMFFENTVIEALPGELRDLKKTSAGDGRFVWQENVIPHHVRLLDPFFEITQIGTDFDITINNATASHFLGYLINSSRLHWRKEMESRFTEANMDEEVAGQMQEYCRTHHFCIDGDGLTEEEIKEQKDCLMNKIFTIGYMLHKQKSPSRAWAPVAMDYKIGDLGECNGRSGKSFMFKTLSMFMKTVNLSGRNPKLMDNPHVFDQVDKHTDLILVDDCAQYLSLNLFYDLITSDLTVNQKNIRSYTIPFKDSPKFAFTTNFVPSEFDASSVARSLYNVFSDYYHVQSSQNDYLESRSIHDDFGKDLFGEAYTDEEWNADINVLLLCLKFYLSIVDTGIKIMPPMDNIIHRKLLQEMGTNFQDWAESYFAPDSGRLDKEIIRKVAFDAFRMYANTNKVTMQRFTRMLKAFVQVCPYIEEMNPPEMCNGQGRIIRRINDHTEDMIYLKMKKEPPPPPEPTLFDNEEEYSPF